MNEGTMTTAATNTNALEAALQRMPRPEVPVQGYHARSDGKFPAAELNVIDPNAAAWDALRSAMVLPPNLRQQRLMAARRDAAAALAFDVLRTRMLRALREHGWHRVGIAAPATGAGASFVTASLALSLSRVEGCRTVALDLDLRRPSLGESLGVRPAGSMADWLSGVTPTASFLQRSGCRLAMGLNARPEPDRADCLLGASAEAALAEMQKRLDPDVILCDMSPVLGNGDTLAFLPRVDCILLVADAQGSSADQITECESLFENDIPFLGVVLNQVEPALRRSPEHDMPD